MRMRSGGMKALMIVGFALALGGCQSVPKGNWRIETGRARLTDDMGEPRTRIEAIALAQRDARLKLLHYVEAMPAGESKLVGDLMAQDVMIATRLRSLILSARQIATRYPKDDTVAVKMGINLDDVLQIAGEAKR